MTGKAEKEAQLTEIFDGWKVPATKYWLYVDGRPVGVGDIRHFLTPALEKAGGHLGYAVRSTARGNGYGNVLLHLLLQQAAFLHIEQVLATIQAQNAAFLAVAKANGGVVAKQTDERVYVWFTAGSCEEREDREDCILAAATMAALEKDDGTTISHTDILKKFKITEADIAGREDVEIE